MTLAPLKLAKFVNKNLAGPSIPTAKIPGTPGRTLAKYIG
jgi:hypothetical protein